ncbi:glycerophosphodiester phosphodiesterase [Urechidicola croceus]|uniref:glycerophosphodiester phosphodiesterase n=1 Tax=Urechidicola croceus TaxID=1850246 RepID=A0A1D8P8Z0_9FLAO|nr:glycerophosphodiester phosphodiesterase [Urechidicola croceus]AOW21005.1 glycerophosphodiester phosphodiesterase [Urechidicola croceus]
MLNRLLLISVLIMTVGCTNPKTTISKMNTHKIVIAHRGASGYLPEHTLEAKAMAHAMKPDYLEQDIVLSKDGFPVVFHDIYLDEITDVKSKFPKRKRIDDRYYVIDFTLEELRQLELIDRINVETGKFLYPYRYPTNRSSFKIHTLEEEIVMIQGMNYSTGKDIGIYPEIKEPAFHRKEGQDISVIVLEILRTYGYETISDNCILQCFDPVELKRIREDLNSELFLVQLMEGDYKESFLKEVRTYANGIGPWYKEILNGKDSEGKWQFSSLVRDAQELDLVVHAYTFRSDDLGEFKSFNELLNVGFNEMNLDGVFTDFPDKAVEFLESKK